MSVSYKKLWHILLDRDMKKKDLAAMAGLKVGNGRLNSLYDEEAHQGRACNN